MNISNVPVGLARSKQLTWQIINGGNVFNWVVGISLILVPDFFNRLFFGHELISHWIYIVIGLAMLWFAVWQVDNFIRPRVLSEPALKMSALMSALAIILLSLFVVMLWHRLLLVSALFLVLIDIVLVVLGVWYWRVAILLSRRD